MHALQAHVETLAAHATAETSLLVIDAYQLRRYPDARADDADQAVIELARDEQVALRLLERETRLALRNPARDQYHAYHPHTVAGAPGEWAILLAPRLAAARVYLSRVSRCRFYRPQDPVAAPPEQPGTLRASWDSVSHAFTHIASDAQTHCVLFASTAPHHLYIPLDAPATARAIPFDVDDTVDGATP